MVKYILMNIINDMYGKTIDKNTGNYSVDELIQFWNNTPGNSVSFILLGKYEKATF